MAWFETLRGMVFPAHCDHMGHVNNRWYAHFFDDASLSLWSQVGLSERALAEKYDSSAVIASSQIDFLHELLAADQFVVRSAFSRLGAKSVTLRSLLYHNDTHILCARQSMVGVFFDPSTRSSAPIPVAVRAILEPLLESAEEPPPG